MNMHYSDVQLNFQASDVSGIEGVNPLCLTVEESTLECQLLTCLISWTTLG